MKLAVMQPYFLPYLGYFQLIAAVDVFVIYDNIKYTKKGWINRNRMLRNGGDAIFSLPLKKESDYLNIDQRHLSADFNSGKLLGQFHGAYRKAPYFHQIFPLVEEVVLQQESNLFRFLRQSIVRVCAHLNICTEIKISSEISSDHTLTGQEKVLGLCNALGALSYVNSIGGVTLYSKEKFRETGVNLQFLQSEVFAYQQFGNTFLPSLSIIDVLMFNSPEIINENMLPNYKLI